MAAMNLPRRLFLTGLPASLALPSAAAGDRLESLLTAVGGRDAWAALTGTRNDSQQNRIDEPTVVRAVVNIDFMPPSQTRVRIDTHAPGLRLARAIDGERHWRLARDGTVGPIPEATLQQDRRWVAGHVYRTLHRLAARDPALTVGTGGGSGAAWRLEVFEAGQRLAWFDLDARGEPFAFGAHDDVQGSLCGPWAFEVQGIRHPVWVAQRDGSWRAWLRELELNPVWPAGFFSEPGSPAR
jgi:hypothetical protein